MPEPMLKPQIYKDDRGPEYFQPFHDRVRAKRPDLFAYEATRIVTHLHALTTFRARAIGSENVPDGPVILAPNHASFMDHFFTAAFVRRHVQFMAKSQMFKPGIAQWIFTHGGVFPVRRGGQDEEAFESAFSILGRGGCVGMYCEGGRTRTGQLADRAKAGIGRLSLISGAAVVPVAILGSDRVRNWKRLEFPRITVSYGRPWRFERIADPTREQQQEAADYVLDRIRTMHTELQRLGHRGARRASSRAGGTLPLPAGT